MDAWYNDVVKPGYLGQSCLSLTNDQQEEMFINGQAGMMIGGPWSIPDFEAKNPDAEYGTFAIPGFNGETMLQGAANVGSVLQKMAKTKKAHRNSWIISAQMKESGAGQIRLETS